MIRPTHTSCCAYSGNEMTEADSTTPPPQEEIVRRRRCRHVHYKESGNIE